ncbi:hypothetical protein [Mannheimia indoligenes]|uniref:hypothetical protein n=1 Tax=Mannheimia indoligenes TaxID=3103145 RepID=UPI002FE50C82
MTRKKKDDEAQNPTGNLPPADNADSTATGENEGSEKSDELSVAEKSEDKALEDKASEDNAVIEPVAFEVKLKSIHPQATYGRCGYRFNKETAVEIPREALTGEQIITLAEDPYLEFVPVVEA